jgi:hypothetical protein
VVQREQVAGRGGPNRVVAASWSTGSLPPHQGDPAADISAETVPAGMADIFLAVSFADRVAATVAAFTKRVISEIYLF